MAIAVLAVVAILARRSLERQLPAAAQAKKSLELDLPAGATFSFQDSWATNLTALIAAIGAVAAVIADKLPDIVDQQSIVEFSIGAGMLALIATFAPIAYAAFAGVVEGAQREEKRVNGDGERLSGNAAGLFTAAFLTLTASFGSLVGILVVVINAHLSGWSKAGIWGACLVGIALVALYAVRTLVTLLETAASHGDFGSLTGMVLVSCCGNQTSRARIALL